MKASAFRHVSPGRLEIRQGGGCRALFGLPFFGAGVLVILIAMGIVPVSNPEETPDFAYIALPLLGIVFTLVGGAMVFGRSWTTVDGAARVVTEQRGLLVPLHTVIHRLDDGVRVVIGFDAGDSDSADQFPVSLRSKGPRLVLYRSTEYAESRACAVEVARLLHADLEDATTDHPVRVRAGDSDLPLHQRMRLEGQARVASARPPAARSEVRREDSGIRITIPVPPSHPVAFVAALIPVGIAVALLGPLSQFFRRTQTPDVVSGAFLGFMVIAFGLLPAMVALNGFLRSRRGATIVTLSSDGIRLQERGAWRTSTIATHPLADIMDVDFGTGESLAKSARQAAEERARESSRVPSGSPVVGARTERMLLALNRFVKGRGVTVRTRQGLTTFGQGLDDDEIRWLHSIVRRALGGDLNGI